MRQILFSGYYGFDNAGDEAVLAGMIAGLQNILEPAEFRVAVLSISPRRTVTLHKVAAADRYKNFFGPISRCDMLCSGGGSLLQDVTSAHGIFYYLALVRLAQILGRKTMFIAQGIGPLKRVYSRKLTAAVANRLDAITVRDPGSAELLRSIGVTKDIVVTADPALLLKPDLSEQTAQIQLSMRPWILDEGAVASKISFALTSSSLPKQIQRLNMYGDGDAKAASAVIERLPHYESASDQSQEGVRSYRQLLNQVGCSQLVVGMRLHALIFAAACGVPSVAISYDPKVDAFMAQSGQTDAVFDLTNDSTGKLRSILNNVWDNRKQRRETLLSVVATLRQKAQENADIAGRLLLA